MDPAPTLPTRPRDGHKGTFGSVGVIGGSVGGSAERSGGGSADESAGTDPGQAPRMIGAPALSAIGASRAGVGLVRVATPAPVLDAVLTLAPSATGIALPTDARGSIVAHDAAPLVDQLCDWADALVFGPGLGTDTGVEAMIVRAIRQEECPVILDADGLNALGAMPGFAGEIAGRVVFTPHPGEFRRLAAPLRIDDDPADPKSRPRACERLAQALGGVVVLKGAGTVVSDGHRTWTCDRGHPCLATAGTGDVLSGVIAGMVAQYAAPPPIAPGVAMPTDPARPLDLLACACAAVQAHAIAGERWGETRGASGGMLATELGELIPGAIESMRAG